MSLELIPSGLQYAQYDKTLTQLAQGQGLFTDALYDLDFQNNIAWSGTPGTMVTVTPASLLTTARASLESSLLVTDPGGAPFLSFNNNIPAIVPGRGLQVYQGATNNLLNSTAPATQTTASLAIGTYVLWCNSAAGGTATVSAGTATITGAGAASQGSPLVFSVTVAGTVTVTVAGTVSAFQLEAGSAPTPLIVTAGSTVTRAFDGITIAGITGLSASKGWTMFVQGYAHAPTNFGTTNTPVQIDDSTNNNRTDIDRNSSNGTWSAGLTINPTAYIVPGEITSATPQFGFFSCAFSATNTLLMFGGQGQPLTTSPGPTLQTNPQSLFTPSRCQVGCGANGNHQIQGIISRLTIWAKALSPAAIQALGSFALAG